MLSPPFTPFLSHLSPSPSISPPPPPPPPQISSPPKLSPTDSSPQWHQTTPPSLSPLRLAYSTAAAGHTPFTESPKSLEPEYVRDKAQLTPRGKMQVCFFCFYHSLCASVRVYCAIAQCFEVCLVLCCVVDSNPYQLSYPVGRALT